MALPDLIEVVPFEGSPSASVVVPGSKSITNRALALAAMADGRVVLEGALWSDDTRYMCEALRTLGFAIEVERDAAEPANRRITVEGRGGEIPRGGTAAAPLELFVGNAGTAARFLTALVALGPGVYRIVGTDRMSERPQAPLIEALRALGYRVDAPGNCLPAVVHGGEPRRGHVAVSAAESSQFASALLLAGHRDGWSVEVTGADADEAPYIEMTRRMLAAFPHEGGTFAVEPDASSASYIWGAAWIAARDRGPGWREATDVRVANWPESGWQVDARFPGFLPLPPAVSRERDLGDSIMTAIALAPLAEGPTRFDDLGRLRVQECERVAALRTELTKCGARVTEEGDSLLIEPGPLHGADIETYSDHRVAMAMATLGLAVPGIRILDAGCVAKTFPNFWQKLALPGPAGLGATLLDGSGTRLDAAALFDE
ncbi:MAG: 3-phosphoshikimate 1-carboxyvinyltransferase [Dehalococcoidia bacterium]